MGDVSEENVQAIRQSLKAVAMRNPTQIIYNLYVSDPASPDLVSTLAYGLLRLIEYLTAEQN